MSDLSPTELKRLLALHRSMGADDNEGEQAFKALRKLLDKHGKSWNDVLELAAAAEAAESSAKTNGNDNEPPPEPPPGVDPKLDALTLTYDIIDKYIDVSDRERLAIALWVLHTRVYAHFSHSPRLALLSPTNGCGKSTVFALLQHLTPEPRITPDITPAAIFRLIDMWHPTLMLDEMDNADLHSGALRKIINTGHSRAGGFVHRVTGTYSVFGPLALAAIGKVLPTPLMKRCVVIDLQRSPKKLPSIADMESDPRLPYVMHRILKWSQGVTLNGNPDLPMINRIADNWRPLIAIGDTFPQWSEKVREVATTLVRSYREEDAAINVLRDARTIIDRDHLDPIFSTELIAKLHDFEEGDVSWMEWRGPKDDVQPHKLTAIELSVLLGRFGIKSASQWTAGGRKSRKGGKGYRRQQFELAWARYCPDDDTPAHTNKIKLLKAS